jgi:hypothetical protein
MTGVIMHSTILTEFFDIRYKANDIAIGDLCDEIEKTGIAISDVENFDPVIYLEFNVDMGISILKGNVIVNRMTKSFETMPKLIFDDFADKNVSYAGIKTKDPSELVRYLTILKQDTLQYTEMVRVDSNLYEWRGLNFVHKNNKKEK